MMTSTQVIETSVTTTDNSPSQDYTHLDDQTTLLHVTLGFKPFTVMEVKLAKLHNTNFCWQPQSNFSKKKASFFPFTNLIWWSRETIIMVHLPFLICSSGKICSVKKLCKFTSSLACVVPCWKEERVKQWRQNYTNTRQIIRGKQQPLI